MTLPYAEPRTVTSIEDCYFYHTMDIPGYSTVVGEWDLRKGLAAYTGGCNFSGKRVLDVGAASGLVSFYLERHGADVVSYDLSEHQSWDIVPYSKANIADRISSTKAHLRKINNGYWLCHKAFNSKARAVHGVVYDIPASIGSVDVAFYGSILLHLRDPFLALQSAAKLCTEAMVVSDVSPRGTLGIWLTRPKFMPNHKNPNDFTETWWRLPPKLVCEYLAILGFEKQELTWHKQLFRGKPKTVYTVVARR